MAPRTLFQSLPDGLQNLSLWDQMFADAGALGISPCTCTGTNALTLTGLTSAFGPSFAATSTFTGYNVFSFLAVNSSTGAMTVRINGLGPYNIFTSNGVQAGAGAVFSGYFYGLVYHPTINSGTPGFLLLNWVGGPGNVTEFPNVQTGATYTFVIGDRGLLVVFNSAVAVAATLPAMPNGWTVDTDNTGTGLVTITAAGNIDGAASIILPPKGGIRIVSTGSTFYSVRGLPYMPDGSVTAPGLAFNLDSDTGFWRPGSNLLAMSCGGTEIVRLGTSGISITTGFISAPDGLVGSPPFTFSADLDTGFYRIGSNDIGVSCGGVMVAEFNSTGIVSPSIRQKATAVINFYVRTNGSDSNNGQADTAGGAFLTLQGANDWLAKNFDFGEFGATVNVRPGKYAPFTSSHPWVGKSFPTFKGWPDVTVTGAANNGSGLVRLTVSSTSEMSTGLQVVVRGVTGTTEANGLWTVTVIDSTHIDLQTSAFVNAYVSGGIVVATIIAATGNTQSLVFCTDYSVLGVQNLVLYDGGFTGCIGLDCSGFAILDPGNITYHTCSSTHLRCINDGSANEQSKCYVTGGAVSHFFASHKGRINPFSSCDVVGGLTVTAWAQAYWNGTINTSGSAVTFTGAGAGAGTTGQKFIVYKGGRIDDTGTTWPGATAGVNYNLDGPGATVTDKAVVRFNGTAGNDAQGSLFIVDDTGNVSSFGGSIKFPASQVASADVNTLDDYEEGTWTPVLTFATPGNLSVAYTTQSADYTKVGREVRVTCTILTSSFTWTTSSGQCQITGLPFTSANTSHSTVGSTAWQGITKAGFTQVGGFINGNDNKITLFAFGSGQPSTAVNAADMPSAGTVLLSITATYHV